MLLATTGIARGGDLRVVDPLAGTLERWSRARFESARRLARAARVGRQRMIVAPQLTLSTDTTTAATASRTSAATISSRRRDCGDALPGRSCVRTLV